MYNYIETKFNDKELQTWLAFNEFTAHNGKTYDITPDKGICKVEEFNEDDWNVLLAAEKVQIDFTYGLFVLTKKYEALQYVTKVLSDIYSRYVDKERINETAKNIVEFLDKNNAIWRDIYEENGINDIIYNAVKHDSLQPEAIGVIKEEQQENGTVYFYIESPKLNIFRIFIDKDKKATIL